jgi:hypothetical protein
LDRQIRRKNKGASLKETTVDKDFLFLLFNDILLQCRIVMNNASAVAITSVSMIPPDATYELQKTWTLSSRSQPASLLLQTWIHSGSPDIPRPSPKELLRIVDDEVIYYLRGAHEELVGMAQAMNGR